MQCYENLALRIKLQNETAAVFGDDTDLDDLGMDDALDEFGIETLDDFGHLDRDRLYRLIRRVHDLSDH